MPTEVKKAIQLEIGHVLFIDIVSYSKLLITEQSEHLQTLKEIVRATEQFRIAEAAGKLLRLPTGDGGALVFRTSPEAPVLCAMEIAKALKDYPDLQVRMGIHSGPVNEISDLNEQANIAGAGINIAQRVMDCGDAGHILLSKHVADDLEQYPQWRSYLHDLGECEVKHGVRVGVVNLSGDGVGNAAAPKKFQAIKKRRAHVRWAAVAVALLVLGAIVGGTFFFLRRPMRSVSGIVDKSIAVLPFENLSSDKENAYFTDGVQDEILTDLAKIADLKVISRTSVMQYKSGLARNLRKIGEELGVAHVVEGSVQRAANKIRVNAQLIDTRTDTHVWAEQYDRDVNDLFGIQSEIAQKIADQLQAKVTAAQKAAIQERPTKDLIAYDLYVRATALADAADPPSQERDGDLLRETVQLLNQAIARDPSFLLAYCKVAEVHDALYFHGFDHTASRRGLAKDALDSAFRLRSNSDEAHLVLAKHFYRDYLNYDDARDHLAIAARTLPNDARVFQLSGEIDRRQGRWRDAVRNFERASELDPQGEQHLQGLGATYRMMRAYKQAREVQDRLVALKPSGIGGQLGRAWIDVDERADTRPLHAVAEKIVGDNSMVRGLFVLALYERDLGAADRALAVLTDSEFGEIRTSIYFNRACAQGLMARAKGDATAAQAAFMAARPEWEEAMDRDHGGARCVLGLIDAGLGRKQEALREGRRALELTPVAKNAVDGPGVLYFFAVICAWTGERDLAIEQLETLAKIPAGASYGDLRLDPSWDLLRGDPRFEKIVASLAPK
jgi:TolB-like protein/class 3 adenylate cyclase